jgi:hypothetical protein
MGQLAKRHGNELCPTAEPFGGVFGGVLFDQTAEFRSREILQKLIEQAGDLYHPNYARTPTRQAIHPPRLTATATPVV